MTLQVLRMLVQVLDTGLTKADCIRAATEGDIKSLRHFFSQYPIDDVTPKSEEISPERIELPVVALQELTVTLFREAIANGHLDIVRELLATPAALSTSSIHSPAHKKLLLSDLMGQAIVEDYADILEFLLAEGADANAELDCSAVDMDAKSNSLPALILAARLGSLEIIQILVNHGANVNTCGPTDGRTALHEAARQDDEDTIEYVVRCGCDINAIDSIHGETPLHVAVKSGKMKAVAALLQHRANVAVTNRRGSCAVHLANVEGHKAILAMLASAGADTTRPATPAKFKAL